MTENPILIDIACLQQECPKGELGNLGWICSGNDIADALTKYKLNSALHDVLRTHKVLVMVEQYISERMIPSDPM